MKMLSVMNDDADNHVDADSDDYDHGGGDNDDGDHCDHYPHFNC